MAYMRIIIAGLFTFFIAFGAHPQSNVIFGGDMGAGFGDVSAEEMKKTCAEIAKKVVSFGGAAVEFAAECAQKIGNDIISGLGAGTKAVVSTGVAVAKCLWSPVDCASEAVDGARAFVDMMSQAVDKVGAMLSNIDPRQAALIACELVVGAVAAGALRGGLPGILANISLKLAKFASLGPVALAVQRLGLASEIILNIDSLVFKQLEKLGPLAREIFAREAKMCPM